MDTRIYETKSQGQMPNFSAPVPDYLLILIVIGIRDLPPHVNIRIQVGTCNVGNLRQLLQTSLATLIISRKPF